MIDRAVAQRVPLNGSIAMTHRCHLRCVHCYLGASGRRGRTTASATPPSGRPLIDQVAEAGCLNLLITGGEPLLRPDFARVYRQARERGILVTVFTNATLVDEPIVQLFEELPPEEVEVTLYGASEEVYERVTGVKGSYRRCLAAVDRLLERGVPVGLKSVILTDNQHEMPALRKMAADRGLDFRVDGALFPCRDGDRAPLDHRVSAADAVAHRDGGRGPSDARPPSTSSARAARRRPRRLFDCMAGLTSFHVDPEGTPASVPDGLHARLRPAPGQLSRGVGGRHPALPRAGDPARVPLPRVRDAIPVRQPARRRRAWRAGSPHRKAEYMCRLGEARLDAVSRKLDK